MYNLYTGLGCHSTELAYRTRVWSLGAAANSRFWCPDWLRAMDKEGEDEEEEEEGGGGGRRSPPRERRISIESK